MNQLFLQGNNDERGQEANVRCTKISQERSQSWIKLQTQSLLVPWPLPIMWEQLAHSWLTQSIDFSSLKSTRSQSARVDFVMWTDTRREALFHFPVLATTLSVCRWLLPWSLTHFTLRWESARPQAMWQHFCCNCSALSHPLQHFIISKPTSSNNLSVRLSQLWPLMWAPWCCVRVH